ncbi:uncharacterized protein LOC111704792 [Eurytemora carolleeae]|uniref:uncharacterized protein LOC111704792 n=1 Tax=Eurytemora carolleeae TaxID=1294199 RepID=UPI000C78BC25|nr:uncharacterized protein LOC111704792 [Eurytemora carolleeae]|eukprot:XP_023332904.1 uncharacterized protein LOC111704792 [Eurytemora affinis]
MNKLETGVVSINISMAPQVSQQPLGFECSLASKILRIMIKILLVPVSTTKDGVFQLRYISWRFFFGWLIWTFLPSSVWGYIFYSDLVLVIEDINEDPGFNNVSDQVFAQTDNILTLVSFWVLPSGMGLLVSQVGSNDNLTLPTRKLELFLCTMLNAIFYTYYLVEMTGSQLFFGLIIGGFYTIHLTSSMFLINVFTSSFIQKCMKFNATQNQNLVDESKLIIESYGNLKKGLGPVLLNLFCSFLISITYTTYWVTYRIRLLDFGNILTGIMIIWNLSLSCQSCFDWLQSTAHILRLSADQYIDCSIQNQLNWRWSEIISETEITAMGFFALSKSSMITAFSTILGYLIVLVQFKVAEQ